MLRCNRYQQCVDFVVLKFEEFFHARDAAFDVDSNLRTEKLLETRILRFGDLKLKVQPVEYDFVVKRVFGNLMLFDHQTSIPNFVFQAVLQFIEASENCRHFVLQLQKAIISLLLLLSIYNFFSFIQICLE